MSEIIEVVAVSVMGLGLTWILMREFEHRRHERLLKSYWRERSIEDIRRAYEAKRKDGR